MWDEDVKSLKHLKIVFEQNGVDDGRFFKTDVFPRKAKNKDQNGDKVRVQTEFPLLVDFYIHKHIPSLLKWGAETAAIVFGGDAKEILWNMCHVLGIEIEWREDQIEYLLEDHGNVTLQCCRIVFKGK